MDKESKRMVPGLCATTHRHTLKHPQRDISVREVDDRYLVKDDVGQAIVVMHYMTKSRIEFYERVCSSVWLAKYGTCPKCSPETHFDRVQTFANNYNDTRMLPFVMRLRRRLELSSVGSSCNTEPTKHSLDHYRECLEKRFYRKA